jgi:hypothetical protein
MRLFASLLFLGLLALPADGQTIWSRPYEPNQLAVEVIAPEAPDEATVLSGATFVTGTVSLNDNVSLAAELPFARYGTNAAGASSTTALGNPYLGVGFSSTTLPFLLEIGTRLPLAPSNAAARLGQSADIGRTSAFRREEFGLSTLLNGRLSTGRNSTLRLRTGLGYASRTRSGNTDRDWRLLYEAQLWREGERLITGLSMAGRAALSPPRQTQHHAVISVMGNWRRVQPGLIAGTSVNDLVQDGDFAPFVGLTLSVTYLDQ